MSAKKSTKSTKIIRILRNPCRTEKWVFQSTRWTCTKRTRPNSNISTLLKNPQIGSNNCKTLKVFKKNLTKSLKNIKTLEQTPAVLKSRSSNLPDGSVPKDPAQI